MLTCSTMPPSSLKLTECDVNSNNSEDSYFDLCLESNLITASIFPAGSLQYIGIRFHKRPARKPGKYERLAYVTRTTNVHQELSWGGIWRYGVHALYGRKTLSVRGHIGPKAHEAPSDVSRVNAHVTRNRVPKMSVRISRFSEITVVVDTNLNLSLKRRVLENYTQ